MEHAKELLSVPLSALAASLFNVSRFASGRVEELVALIDSRGLLHNLVVTDSWHGASGPVATPGSGAIRDGMTR